MPGPASPKEKKFTFGTCDFDNLSPALAALTSTTEVLNVRISFEDALKFHLAIEEGLRKLNSFNRATKEGKRSALNVAIYLSKKRISVNRVNLPS